MLPGRERCLQLIQEHLARTELGREFELRSIRNLADLRASVPLMDRATHQLQVEQKVGFGVVDASDERAPELAGSPRERGHVVGVWKYYLGEQTPQRIALLRGHHVDPIVDRILVEDLRALGGDLVTVDHGEEPEAVMKELEALDPDVLVMPSAMTCRWLERAHRAPLERRLQRLRLILAEHDLRRPVRSRVRLRSAGWVHRAGRVALPSVRESTHAVTLAVGTSIVELLPRGDPEEGRRTYADATILPEQAALGQRYEVVLTSPLGFLRLRTDEHVRVVGFDAPSEVAPFPRPRVVRLTPAPRNIQLEGCTLAGAWLTAGVRQAFFGEDPALVAAEVLGDPHSAVRAAVSRSSSFRVSSVFAETELGWLSRTGVHRVRKRARSLLVRVEVQGQASRVLPRQLALRIDADLQRRSPAYRYLRERGDLHQPRVTLLKAGTRRIEEERRIRELLGAVWMPEVRVVER